LVPIELDVSSEEIHSKRRSARLVADKSRLDVLMHNAGHMVFWTGGSVHAEQLAELYDINVLSTKG